MITLAICFYLYAYVSVTCSQGLTLLLGLAVLRVCRLLIVSIFCWKYRNDSRKEGDWGDNDPSIPDSTPDSDSTPVSEPVSGLNSGLKRDSGLPLLLPLPLPLPLA